MTRIEGTRAPLIDTIRRAQQAQQDNPQKHDVQLSVLPFANDPFSDERFAPEPEVIEWATEEEKAEQFHAEIDAEWTRWWNAHPCNAHHDPRREP